MQEQQIIHYIHRHIHQGYSETALRNHFKKSGLTQEAIDQAFAKYYATVDTPTQQPITTRQIPKDSKKKWLAVVATLLLVVIIGSIFYFASTGGKLEQPALEQNSQNTARDSDAMTIISAINSYIASNNGNLPQTVEADAAPNTVNLCGTSCGNDSVNVNLGYYQPKAIESRTYAVDLKVSDVDSLYIVNNAVCNDTKDGVKSTEQSGQLSTAVLYGVKSGSDFRQKCVSL